jgi:hypothetical protein
MREAAVAAVRAERRVNNINKILQTANGAGRKTGAAA